MGYKLVRQSLDIQESVKSGIAEIRQEMCTKENNMRQTMEGIEKATKCMEEKLDTLVAKLREKESWKRFKRNNNSSSYEYSGCS